jgi:hypothetical protein
VLCEDYRVRKVLNQSRLESVCIVWEFINGGVLLAIGQGVNVFYFIWGNKMQPNGSIWLSRLIWILDPFIVEFCFLGPLHALRPPINSKISPLLDPG